METVLSAIILILLLLFGTLTLSHALIDGQDTVEMSRREMHSRLDAQARTGLEASAATIDSAGAVVDLAFENTATNRLADFDRWDLILQYTDEGGQYHIDWLPPVSGEPGGNEWSVVGIYQDAGAAAGEVFERGILNPGEEMLIRVRLPSSAGVGTTNLVTLSTDNGVTAPAFFVRPTPTPIPTATPDSTGEPDATEEPELTTTPEATPEP